MKISELITEEMVRGIIPEAKRHEFLGIQNKDYDGHTQYLAFKEHEYGGDRCPAFTIPLAQFLFVDAWDYFNKKGWYIEMYTRIIRVSEDDIEWHTVVITDYPSRLHAMAAAVKFMWEQEGKTNEQ